MSNTEYNSRTADKFVVRMPGGMREQIEKLATEQHTSMNTEIVQAIEAHLAGRVRQKLLLDALEAKLVEHPAAASTPVAALPEADYLDGLKTGTR